jgi:hypothetical protein
MNTSDKVLMWISIALVVIVLLLFGVRVVFAESVCDNPYAENYGQPSECTWGGIMPDWDGIPMGVCADPNNPDYPGADYLEYLNGIGMGYVDVCGWDPQPAEPPEPEPSVSQQGRTNYRLQPVKPVYLEPENAL